MNKVVLVGRFTKEIEIKEAGNTSIVKNTLAVDRKFKKEGEQTADFINVIAFGKTAEFISKYFAKGNKIGIAGHIQTGSYENKDGQKVYTTDVIIDECEFVEGKSDNTGNTRPNPSQANEGFINVPDGIDEELPFN